MSFKSLAEVNSPEEPDKELSNVIEVQNKCLQKFVK